MQKAVAQLKNIQLQNLDPWAYQQCSDNAIYSWKSRKHSDKTFYAIHV